jgi:hypothetical protein
LDTTTIIVIIAVVAILVFLWPRVSAPRRVPTNLNPPGTEPGAGESAIPGNRASRADVTAQTDRPSGQRMPTNAAAGDGDVVDEAIDDIRSQNPNKSL